MSSERKIIIAEDDKISSLYLKKLLEEASFNVLKVVSKGRDIMAAARDLSPDLILTDIYLKDDISGCEAAAEISRIYPEIAIIFLTAYVNDDILSYAKESNACSYLDETLS